MGQALAGALLSAGHPTTVWNRSADKATMLTARGAPLAETASAAIADSDVAIVCLLDDAAVRAVLEPLGSELRGTTIVNVTNGLPAHARAQEGWMRARGVDYVHGGIMAVPPTIGQLGAFILCSGATDVFRRVEPALAAFGRSIHVGEDAGLASLYDMALLGGMYGMFAGAQQAIAMVASGDGEIDPFMSDLLLPWMEQMLPFVPMNVNARGEVAPEFNPQMQAVALENMIEATRAQGLSDGLIGHLHVCLDLMRNAAPVA
ncbi:hypothetical protein DSM104299_04159 [Baekduia alba]|nr:hypothetical protein DSM104299_04159 [Baekduia alba]